MSAAYITFDVAAFRVKFPAFADPAKYPTPILEEYFKQATCIVSNANYGWLVNCCRSLALDLLVAHLATLFTAILAGTPAQIVTSATIDKVTVSIEPPPTKNQFDWWLSLSPYGAQLLALLQAQSMGGFYIGGNPELSAFRKVGGIY